ncbi:hypothetical protein SeMB42_g02827 [Synchytrium endobioticum]|uniref:Chromatin modification-related protein EAF6 n=1 Tax=Synchytrium endobioticum TaxID=286115 RepID=A0A507DGU6_9FUNG|nr:hypothetical protein SeMB42_g02827 [Synchytrium endobioticum]TPX50535.1 hypothetical protein SeLEV6574_g00857 [Synchytrium endobioticum]
MSSSSAEAESEPTNRKEASDKQAALSSSSASSVDNKENGNATASTANADGPPASSAAAIDQATMDHLTEAEKILSDLVHKKKQLDKQLAGVEASIYALEESYLTDTQQYGNVVRGFDGYLHGRPDKKKYKINDADRLFSHSSVTFQHALEIKAREEGYMQEEEEMFHRRKKSRYLYE